MLPITLAWIIVIVSEHWSPASTFFFFLEKFFFLFKIEVMWIEPSTLSMLSIYSTTELYTLPYCFHFCFSVVCSTPAHPLLKTLGDFSGPWLVLSLTSFLTTLHLAHSAPATLASLLFLGHTNQASISFVQEVFPSRKDIPPSDLCMLCSLLPSILFIFHHIREAFLGCT